MSELIPMTELTDTELEAVCGGLFDFGNVVPQTNTANQTAVNAFTVGSEIEQTAFQHNTSLIGSLVFI
jgi:hypothetical protein